MKQRFFYPCLQVHFGPVLEFECFGMLIYWIISKTFFRHKPLRNFTVICQLDRKYYIPQGLTFCKAVKAYRIRFLRNALFQIDFTLLFEYDFNSIVTPNLSVFILKLMWWIDAQFRFGSYDILIFHECIVTINILINCSQKAIYISYSHDRIFLFSV